MGPAWTRESTAALQAGLRQSAWNITELWVAAVGIGGSMRHRDVQEIAAGDRAATRAEHDVLACALNDYFAERGQDHPVALSDELTGLQA